MNSATKSLEPPTPPGWTSPSAVSVRRFARRIGIQDGRASFPRTPGDLDNIPNDPQEWQGPALCLELGTRRAWIGRWDASINGMSPAYWNRLKISVDLPGFRTGTALARWLLDHEALCLIELIDQCKTGWDGRNHVGWLTDEAKALWDQIEWEADEVMSQQEDYFSF